MQSHGIFNSTLVLATSISQGVGIMEKGFLKDLSYHGTVTNMYDNSLISSSN